MEHPNSRKVALAQGSKVYFTGEPCPKGHVALRRAGTGGCVECANALSRAKMAKLRAEQPDKIKQQKQAEYERNKAKYIARTRAAYEADPEAHRAKAREYAAQNREAARQRVKQWKAENKEYAKLRDQVYRAENPHVQTAARAKYRATKLKATPPWLSDEHRKAIKALYNRAAYLTRTTGTPHHVDHEVPLQGGTVCGLHVPWNLRVLPGVENIRRPRLWRDV